LQSNDLYLGIGEAAGSHSHPPYTDGQEWVLNTENKNGKYFSYLSLAFKVDLRA
jgi:membrane-bound lytic murein transglycosylase